MSFKDWISYLLQKMMWYMETPRSERKSIKASNREAWSVRWFGMIPFSMKMYVDKQRSRIRGRLSEK
ncbi:YqzE family protein [Paenactinomyces guangxiensis]|uniref:YqzE family protein n=2 Tax=Paenactinomyces guangxiensis TaxID=1490290 RepID=A0A7W1WNV5_9BACL|nr:YqzE family protein [Paenactinomyces guangxiensis]MBH8589874.1 YqzE family protein [Paenactinomyces guangxiensis]